MRVIRAVILLGLCSVIACGCRVGQDRPEYGVLIGVNPEEMDILYEYTTVVIDAAYYTKSDIDSLHQNGVTVYSYLNIGTIETFRENYRDYQHCVLGAYGDWPGEYWVDVSQAAWQEHIAELAKELVQKGVDGFFLDNTDVYYEYCRPEIFDGLVTMIGGLEQYQKEILVNGGDVFVTKAVLNPENPLIQISGVNQECVFTDIDFEEDTLIEQDSETSQYYQAYLEQCSAKNLEVYITEYIKSNNKALMEKIENYCSQHSYHYFISSSKELDG